MDLIGGSRIPEPLPTKRHIQRGLLIPQEQSTDPTDKKQKHLDWSQEGKLHFNFSQTDQSLEFWDEDWQWYNPFDFIENSSILQTNELEDSSSIEVTQGPSVPVIKADLSSFKEIIFNPRKLTDLDANSNLMLQETPKIGA